MSKPKIPNQRNEYKKLNARLNKYVLQVEDIYTAITEQAAQMATRVGYDGDMEFRFSDYPQIKAQVDELAANYVADMENLIYAGTSAEWANSNLVQDLLVNKVLKAYNAQVSGEKYKVYYDSNSEHLKTFQQRRDRGMNLSQRLWNQSSDMLTELEETISTAIQKGMSAVTLSKRISKYLQDFPKMQKDYTKKYGKATRSYDCEYRSIRLARSEINMAYRSAENERWRKLDFVVGYEIKVSHKHTVPDICDDLAGKYPKDFEWVGWHPNCTDYKIPILKTEDEFFSVDDKPSVNEVKDVPPQFKKWVQDNQDSIEKSQKNGTQPYFIRDNTMYVALSKRNNVVESPIMLTVKGSDVNNAMLNNLRKNAEVNDVNVKELDDFIEAEELHSISGQISETNNEKLTQIYDKYENKVLGRVQYFHRKKDELLGFIDEHYQYGDFALTHKNAIKKITVSDKLHYNDAISQLDSYKKKLQDEYMNFASNPLALTSKFNEVDVMKYVNASGYDEIFSSAVDLLNSLYGSRLPMSPLYHSMHKKGKSLRDACREFGKEFREKGLKEVLESVDKLRELQKADLSRIHKPWIAKFNDYMCNINSHNIVKDGYIHIYNDIEGACNIFRLSTDSRCVKYGLNKLSVNTPHGLINELHKVYTNAFEVLAKKEFYDGFEEFVPVIFNYDKGFYHPDYRHVCFDTSSRTMNNPTQAIRLQYHEFGHSMDWNLGAWRNKPEWLSLYDKVFDSYNKDKGWVKGDYVNGATFRERLENLSANIAKTKENEELIGAVSDVLQAFDKDHIRYSTGGHDKKYYDEGGKQACLAEIIAHATEFYWQENIIFTQVYPSLYTELKRLYKVYFEKYKNRRY